VIGLDAVVADEGLSADAFVNLIAALVALTTGIVSLIAAFRSSSKSVENKRAIALARESVTVTGESLKSSHKLLRDGLSRVDDRLDEMVRKLDNRR
jgi:hypothetical protein